MSGYVFISYGRTDRRVAHAVARELDERGFSVWWDPKIDAGVAYDRVIEAALAAAACVVVLWSAHSVESDWVRAEADDGRKRGLLVPALIEPVNPPLQFRLLETIDLTRWADDRDPVAFDRFCAAIAHHTAPADRLTRWKDGLRSGTGLHTAPLGPHHHWVSSVRFLDDHSAMTATGDGTVRVWDVAKGIERMAFSAHDGTAWCCDCDSTMLVTGGADRTVRIWDRDGYSAVRTLEGHGGWVLACALSRRGDLLASASRDESVRLWNTRTWTERAVLTGHRGAVWSAAFAPDGERLATCSDDQTVRVWSTVDGTQLCVMRDHTAPVMACLPLPDGERALSGGYDTVVRCWYLRSGAVDRTFPGSTGWILSLAVTPDGALALAGTSTGEVLAWDLSTGELVARVAHHRGPIMSLDFRANAGLLSGSADESASLLGVRPFDVPA